jgi:hypothetical protein
MYREDRRRGATLAVAVPALVIGLAAGVTGGVVVAGAFDTTPYGEVRLNTATRNAHQAGRAEGLREAQTAADQVMSRLRATNANQVTGLEADLTETRRALSKARKQADRRETELESALAETTAALRNATSETAGADTLVVEGTVRATRVVGPGARPWPNDCSEPLRTYQVRVTAGEGATVAFGELVDAELRKRSVEKKTLTLTCSLTYSVRLPTPLGHDYRFLAVDESQPDAPLTNNPAPGTSLEDGTGPVL